MCRLFLALLLSSCAAPEQPPTRPEIPTELRSCPAAPPALPPPPPPRTFDAVVDWAAKVESRRRETVQALEVCRAKLIQRNQLGD